MSLRIEGHGCTLRVGCSALWIQCIRNMYIRTRYVYTYVIIYVYWVYMYIYVFIYIYRYLVTSVPPCMPTSKAATTSRMGAGVDSLVWHLRDPVDGGDLPPSRLQCSGASAIAGETSRRAKKYWSWVQFDKMSSVLWISKRSVSKIFRKSIGWYLYTVSSKEKYID